MEPKTLEICVYDEFIVGGFITISVDVRTVLKQTESGFECVPVYYLSPMLFARPPTT